MFRLLRFAPAPQSSTLAPGDAAPDFRLPSIYDTQFGLLEALLDGPVVVEFVRGTWCPITRERLALLVEAKPELESRNARLVVIAGESLFTAKRHFDRQPRPLTILVDEPREVVRAYGVHQQFAIEHWNFARPSTFIIDRAGFVRWVFVSGLRTQAADPAMIVEQLDAIAKAAHDDRRP